MCVHKNIYQKAEAHLKERVSSNAKNLPAHFEESLLGNRDKHVSNLCR